jgi:hypothetical protein
MKKELAKEKQEKREKAKAQGLKKIAALERANTMAYANDETPRPIQTSSHASGPKWSKAQKPSGHETPSSSSSASEFTSTRPDETSNIKEQPHASHVLPIEGSEPSTNLEQIIKKKSKRKPNVCKLIEDLKQGDGGAP